ncbi:MAG: T9SS C-terminal target domain-containing protein [Calditrichaeota bacterium]|nr:MAG: T9SS C-terminal target domain-containing protein [Calditrichota bacterium]
MVLKPIAKLTGALAITAIIAGSSFAQDTVNISTQLEGNFIDGVAIVEGSTYTFVYNAPVHDALIDGAVPIPAMATRLKSFLAGIDGMQLIIPSNFTNVDPTTITANFNGFNTSPVAGGNIFNDINGVTPWLVCDFSTNGTNPFNTPLQVDFATSGGFETIAGNSIPGYTIGSEPLNFAEITGGNFDVSGTTVLSQNPFSVSVSHFTPFAGVAASDVPLSVTLSSFEATQISEGIKLNWSTESEVNNLGFGLYRTEGNSFDLDRATKLGDYRTHSELAGNGTSSQSSFYTFVDKNVENKTYTYVLSDFDAETGEEIHTELAQTVSFKTNENNAKLSFKLAQNYPNPFNPETTIEYSVKEAVNVELSIFNVKGEVVRTLTANHSEATNGSFNWNGTDDLGKSVASGIYFYKLTAGDFSSTKQMILLK